MNSENREDKEYSFSTYEILVLRDILFQKWSESYIDLINMKYVLDENMKVKATKGEIEQQERYCTVVDKLTKKFIPEMKSIKKPSWMKKYKNLSS